MYIICYERSFPQLDGRLISSYFIRFGVFNLREYGKKAEAMQFPSRKAAEAFLAEDMGNPKYHKVVKI